MGGWAPRTQAKKKDKLLTMDPKEITYEMVNRKLREIIMSRGRRSTDKQEQVRRAPAARNSSGGTTAHARKHIQLEAAGAAAVPCAAASCWRARLLLPPTHPMAYCCAAVRQRAKHARST